MKFRGVNYEKNDEYHTPIEAMKPLIKYLPKNLTIWCPFDFEDSNIVKVLKDIGHTCIATHINNGEDFFKIRKECDVIISNPPYSLRTEVFQRLFSLEHKFAMIVGNLGLFDSKIRFDLFAKNQFEIMFLDKRVKFSKNSKKKSSPPFSSSWVSSGILPKNIIFERL